MASPNLSEIVTTTLRNRSKKLADNVTDNNALLHRLKKKGNTRSVSGGRAIVEELEYDENSTFQRYSGYETLDISPSDVFSAAEFAWKQAKVSVVISGLEQIQNDGPERVINLLEKRIKNAERTMMNQLASDVYSDGTADGGKQIGGLALLVADSPATGTVGGIDRASWSFWRNVSYDATSDGGGATTASNIQSYMNALAVQLVRGKDSFDLIMAGDNKYTLFLESLQAIQRITNKEMAGAGFANVTYWGGGKEVPVVLDGGQGGNCPTDSMYFLNTDYIHYRPSSKRNMEPTDDLMNTNQDAIVKHILWAGNMTVSNASLQGVFKE